MIEKEEDDEWIRSIMGAESRPGGGHVNHGVREYQELESKF